MYVSTDADEVQDRFNRSMNRMHAPTTIGKRNSPQTVAGLAGKDKLTLTLMTAFRYTILDRSE